MKSLFIKALDAINKEDRLLKACQSVYFGDKQKSVYEVESSILENIPGKPLAYWCSNAFYSLFTLNPAFANEKRGAYVGLQTSDDSRFVRLMWEIDKISLKEQWYPFAKGGEYSPYYADIHLCVNWTNSGKEIKNFRNSAGKLLSRPQNTTYYFKSGITWPERTTSGFGTQVLPAGTIFSQVGLGMFLSSQKETISWLVILNTRVYQYIAELLIGLGEETVSGSAGRHYTGGMVSKLPYIESLSDDEHENLHQIFLNIEKVFSYSFSLEETSPEFNPKLIHDAIDIESLSTQFETIRTLLVSTALEASNNAEIFVRKKLNLLSDDVKEIIEICGPHPILDLEESTVKATKAIEENWSKKIDKLINSAVLNGNVGRYITKKSFFVDRDIELFSQVNNVKATSILEANKSLGYKVKFYNIFEISYRVLSYLLGVSFGRFDVVYKVEKLENPFDEREYFGLVKNFIDSPYVLECLDQGTRGIVTSIQESAEKVWGSNKREKIISEIMSNLEVNTLNDVFLKTNKFFDFHLAQYSKSRRQAPIYWPLQTRSDSYIIWIYFHRINDQSLYSCVNDFVEPKLESVNTDLTTLRNIPSRSKDEEIEFGRLTDLKVELEDFRVELLRIAKFWKPNLNDGVQITAAPLWRLFQHKAWQKKLKDTWEKLEEGEYDWAHLAYSIWPARVLRKCHQDRSLAIAHDVENQLWHEVEVTKGRNKNPVWEWQPKPLSDAELNTYIQAKIQAMGHVE